MSYQKSASLTDFLIDGADTSPLVLVKEEDFQEDIKNSKGRLITCKHCKEKFKYSREDKQKWFKNGGICPSCGIDLCYLPPTERKLSKLQDHWLRDKKPEIMEEMYMELKSYANTLIKKKYYTQYAGKPEELEYHSHCTAWYLIEHYYREGKNFKISSSFGSYLRFTMMQSVYDNYYAMAPVSLNYEDPESKRVYELPSKKDFIKDYEEKNKSISLVVGLSNLISGMSDFSNDQLEDFNRLIALKLYFQKGEKSVDRFFQKTERIGKRLYEKSLSILKEELYKLAQSASA